MIPKLDWRLKIFLIVAVTIYLIYEVCGFLNVWRQLRSLADPPNASYWQDLGRRKVILFATTWFKQKRWPGARNTKELQTLEDPPADCPVSNCVVTYDIGQFHYSDVVVVHGVDTDILPALRSLRKLHDIRPKEQRWLWLMHESPMHTNYNVDILNGIFNWTETYRHDSDIFFPYDYYYHQPSDELMGIDYSLNKTNLVAWMASNLNAQYRIDFAKELIKSGVEVDIFGKASPFNKTRVCGWSCSGFFKAYKFYLAFENSYCEDYVTEKYWLSLRHNMVPIVIGGSYYSNPSVVIPKSCINAMDFDSIKDLADYLLYLDKNNTAYNEFFWWKSKYKIGVQGNSSKFCNICMKINSVTDMQKKTYANFTQFWGLQTCKDVESTVRAKFKIYRSKLFLCIGLAALIICICCTVLVCYLYREKMLYILRTFKTRILGIYSSTIGSADSSQ